jgi:hypothetical protein
MQNNTNWPVRKFDCPHCHAVSAFTCVYSAFGKHSGSFYPISVWACHHCDRGIFIKHEKTPYQHVAKESVRVDTAFPLSEPSANENIPDDIAADFIESAKCLNVSAYKASAVMARRTIQKMCLDLGADKSKKLHRQIKSLRDAGKLHSDLADMATEIRFLGNYGAHPNDDGVDQIDEDEAREILNFTSELLDDLYVRPQKIQAMKKRREDRENNSEKETEP